MARISQTDDSFNISISNAIVSSPLLAGYGIRLDYEESTGLTQVSLIEPPAIEYRAGDFVIDDGELTLDPSVARFITTDSGVIAASDHNFNVLGGTDISTAVVGDDIVINFTGGADSVVTLNTAQVITGEKTFQGPIVHREEATSTDIAEVETLTLTSSAVSDVVVDSLGATSFVSAKYIVHMSQPGTSAGDLYESCELMVTHNNGANITTTGLYAQLFLPDNTIARSEILDSSQGDNGYEVYDDGGQIKLKFWLSYSDEITFKIVRTIIT